MVPAVVSVNELVKRYGNLTAVSGVGFEVAAGEILALLGPNGAGKTTTVEILEGFRQRDSGDVRVLGYDPAERATSRQLRERIGVVLQELAVEPFLSVRQALTRNAGYYPNPRPVDEVLSLVELEEKADRRVKTLSGGQQRRLDLGLGIGFSIVFLILLGSSTGSSTDATLGGVRVIQYYVPGFLSYGVMASCFNTLAISMVVRRETGLLKRIRLSPLPTWAMIAAICINVLIVSFLQVVVLLLIGRFGYNVHMPHNVVALVVALLVGAVSFTAVGIALSTVVPNQEAAGPMVSVVFFVLLFISGLWYPISSKSGLARVASFFPLRHMITSVYAPFDPRPHVSGWSWGDIGVMTIWGVVGVYVAARRWSWSPRQAGARSRGRAATQR